MTAMWAATGLLAAALFATIFSFNARIDNLASTMHAGFNAMNARIDDVVRGLADVRVELADVRKELADMRKELADLGSRFDRHKWAANGTE